MIVYLAGPMRGLHEWNWPAFAAARARWQQAGHRVFCPAAVAAALGYGPDQGHDAEPGTPQGAAHLRHVLQSDVLCLTNADAIALLPGWERSRGVTVELATAQFLGLAVYDAVTMRPLTPPTTPWNCLGDCTTEYRPGGISLPDDDWYSARTKGV